MARPKCACNFDLDTVTLVANVFVSIKDPCKLIRLTTSADAVESVFFEFVELSSGCVFFDFVELSSGCVFFEFVELCGFVSVFLFQN